MNCVCTQPGACPRHRWVTNTANVAACRAGCPAGNEAVPCAYLGAERRPATPEGGPAWYECRLHGECTLGDAGRGWPACAGCRDKLPFHDNDFADKFLDPLNVRTADRTQTHALRGTLAGGPAFLVCGGPSLLTIDYHALAAPGVFSLGVNNVAAMVPVRAFICSDPPEKFHHRIFADPTMMKFVPTQKLKPRKHLRIKQLDGTFVDSQKPLIQYPNVWGYDKRGWFLPDDTFFTEPAASLGNYDEGLRRLGPGTRKGVLTMLAAFRILYYLGARTIYLVGCDFRMTEEQPYAFNQGKDPGGVTSNNERYALVNEWLCGLRPVFKRYGLQVRNTFLESGLQAFCYTPFEAALRATRAAAGALDTSDLGGWYDK